MKGDLMKCKISFTFLFACLSSLLWISCDKIDEPLIIVAEQLTTDGFLDTLYFIDTVNVGEKQVLLEDFTGHKCVNCPEAALAARDLAETLNGRLIIYSIHAGYYAEPDATGDYTADFRCPTGDQLNNDFLVLANPLGLIDRVKYNGSVLIGAGNWEAAVMLELDKPNTVILKVRNIYYPNLNKVQTDVVSRFLSQEAGIFKIVVYVVEDGIISPQKNNNPAIGPSPDWFDYEHHNILRGAINSTYGNNISSDGTIVAGQDYHNQFTLDIDTGWVASNCNIIIYVISEETDEILQVAELRIRTQE